MLKLQLRIIYWRQIRSVDIILIPRSWFAHLREIRKMRNNLKISRQFSCILYLKNWLLTFLHSALFWISGAPFLDVFGKIKLGAIWGSPRDHRFSPIALRQLFDYLRVIESWADLDGGGIFEAKAAKVKLPSLFGTGWQDGIPWLELHRGEKPVSFLFAHEQVPFMRGRKKSQFVALWVETCSCQKIQTFLGNEVEGAGKNEVLVPPKMLREKRPGLEKKRREHLCLLCI